MAASFGPEALARHQRARAAAEAAAALNLPTTKGGRLKAKVRWLQTVQLGGPTHASVAVQHAAAAPVIVAPNLTSVKLAAAAAVFTAVWLTGSGQGSAFGA
jgi:hypothetical protein